MIVNPEFYIQPAHFKSKGQVMTFSDKQNQKEFINWTFITRHIKQILEAEGI